MARTQGQLDVVFGRSLYLDNSTSGIRTAAATKYVPSEQTPLAALSQQEIYAVGVKKAAQYDGIFLEHIEDRLSNLVNVSTGCLSQTQKIIQELPNTRTMRKQANKSAKAIEKLIERIDEYAFLGMDNGIEGKPEDITPAERIHAYRTKLLPGFTRIEKAARKLREVEAGKLDSSERNNILMDIHYKNIETLDVLISALDPENQKGIVYRINSFTNVLSKIPQEPLAKVEARKALTAEPTGFKAVLKSGGALLGGLARWVVNAPSRLAQAVVNTVKNVKAPSLMRISGALAGIVSVIGLTGAASMVAPLQAKVASTASTVTAAAAVTTTAAPAAVAASGVADASAPQATGVEPKNFGSGEKLDPRANFAQARQLLEKIQGKSPAGSALDEMRAVNRQAAELLTAGGLRVEGDAGVRQLLDVAKRNQTWFNNLAKNRSQQHNNG